MGRKKADGGKMTGRPKSSLRSVNATHISDTYMQLVLDKYEADFTLPKFSCFYSQEHWNKTSQGRPDSEKSKQGLKWIHCTLHTNRAGNSRYEQTTQSLSNGKQQVFLKRKISVEYEETIFLTVRSENVEVSQMKSSGKIPETLVTRLDTSESVL